MAFFTRTSSSIPYLPTDECHVDNNTLKHPKDGIDFGSASNNIGPILTTKPVMKSPTNKISAPTNDLSDSKSNECTDQYTYVIDRVLGVEV